MKRIISAVIAFMLIAGASVTAYAKENDSIQSGRTGGIIIDKSTPSVSYLSQAASGSSSLPEYYSSVDKGYVTPVKDQKTQNTCIFFSATAAMESSLLRNGYGEYDLSEEYANYWASKRKDGTGWQRDRVNIGAFPYTGYGYLSTGGVVLESDLPYMSRTEQFFEDIEYKDPLFYAGGIKLLSPPAANPDEFKAAIMECGGVSGSFAYYTDNYNSATKSYYCGDTHTVEELASGGHAVLFVGWDDNYSRTNFKQGAQPKNNGAWLIKNSWGSTMSYIWVSYEDNYVGSDLFGNNYGINGIIKNHSCNELLKVDSYGTIYDTRFTNGDGSPVKDTVFINVFDFNSVMPSVRSVEFSTSNVGADYTIYYIPTQNGIPDSNEKNWKELASGVTSYAGTHNIPVTYKVKDSQGAIGVRISSNDDMPASLGSCESIIDPSQGYLFKPAVKGDRSYVKIGSYSMNLTDFYLSSGDEYGADLTIRAVMNVQIGDVNKDGSVDICDTTQIQNYLVGNVKFSQEDQEISDVNGDGSINVSDATEIQKYIAGIISSFKATFQNH